MLSAYPAVVYSSPRLFTSISEWSADRVISIIAFTVGSGLALWGIRATRKAAVREPIIVWRMRTEIVLEVPKKRFPPLSTEGLKVYYDGNPVTEVRRGHVALWNAGNGTLDPSSNLDGRALRLRFSGPQQVVVLASSTSPTLVSCAGEELGLQVKAAPDDAAALELRFTHLPPKAGALIEFLFTGEIADQRMVGLNRQHREARLAGRLKLYSHWSGRRLVEHNLWEFRYPLLATWVAAGALGLADGEFLLVLLFAGLATAAFIALTSTVDWLNNKPDMRDYRIPKQLRYWPEDPAAQRPLTVRVRRALVAARTSLLGFDPRQPNAGDAARDEPERPKALADQQHKAD